MPPHTHPHLEAVFDQSVRMKHLNILSTWFLMFKTDFQLQLVASSSLIKKTPMIVDKSTLCFCFFWGKQMEKSIAKRDTTLSNDTWAMSREIKGPLRTKHHILSLPTTLPPLPKVTSPPLS
jgi:hypothetical protein